MKNDVITLITVTDSINSYGDTVQTRTEKTVFAEIKSIGMRETYEAMAVGLKPEYTFVIEDYYDYDGQELVKHNNIEYRVIRTYRKSRELEIVVTKNVDA